MSVALEPVTETGDAAPKFEVVHRVATERLGPALAFALDDVPVAIMALERSLALHHQRWRRGSTPSLDAALEDLWHSAFGWAMSARWPRTIPELNGPAVLDRFASGADPQAIAALGELPIRQRSTVVAHHWLGWSVEGIARAHRVGPSTITLRHNRALAELARSLAPIDLRRPGVLAGPAGPGGPGGSVDSSCLELTERIAGALAAVVPGALDRAEHTAGIPDLATTRVSARRRTVRNRLAVTAIAVGSIALTGVAIRALPNDDGHTPEVIETVDPPRASQAPHAPISDGAGGFVALTHSAGLIATSADGSTWFPTSRLNVDQVDLRLFVERIFRSDGRYIALVDSTTGGGLSVSGSDSLRIAVADDLSSWELVPVDIGPLPEIAGLKPSIDLLNAAVAGNRMLIAISVDYEIDFHAQRVRRSDVCTVADTAEGLILHLCDGEQIAVVTDADRSGLTADRRLYARDGDGPFAQLNVDDNFNPWGLLSANGRFAMLNEATSLLSTSADGESWEPLFDLSTKDRLGLVVHRGADLLTIAPSSQGWVSQLIQPDRVLPGQLPISIDPTTVWLKPQVVSGPAGWAMFVTTSRPWERRDSAVGWAVHAGEWIVEQRPGLGEIRARSTTTGELYDYRRLLDSRGRVRDHPSVRRGQFGGVRLERPGTDELLIEITGDQIRRSWLTGESVTGAKGRVEIDGWVLRGNIRTGPITLTAADGSFRSWSDGFAFTDGDLDDGVESTLLSTTDGSLTLIAATGERVEFQTDQLADALDPPEPVEGPDQIRAVVLFSANGVDWARIWETTHNTWYGSIAVGDDEVLISAHGLAAEPKRIPVAQSD